MSEEQLSENQAWMIVENLMCSYQEMKKRFPKEKEIIKNYELLLDMLSPNWRRAKTDDAVEIRNIIVLTSEGKF